MPDIYLDDPTAVEKWIEKLTPEEHKIFNAGYAVALRGLMESLTETKREMCAKVMEVQDAGDGVWMNQLLARIHTLDSIEIHYSQRLKTLKTPF